MNNMDTKEAIITKMQSLMQNFESISDNRAISLNCYLLMTINMLKAVEADEFEDSAWVNTLVHRFVELWPTL